MPLESQDPVNALDFLGITIQYGDVLYEYFVGSGSWGSCCLQKNAERIVPLLSVAVPAPIILKPLQIF